MEYLSFDEFVQALINKELPKTAVLSKDKECVYVYERDFDPETGNAPPILYKTHISPEEFLTDLFNFFGIKEIY